MLVAWFVINIPNLSPTHLVSNIRHQHRVIEQKPRESKIFSTIFLKKNFNLFFLLNLLQLYKLLLWFFSPLTIRLGIDKSPMKSIGFFLNVPLDSKLHEIAKMHEIFDFVIIFVGFSDKIWTVNQYYHQ